MTDEVYQPVLTPKEAQKHLDNILDGYQIDYIPRVDLGEEGPRRIPMTLPRHAALAVFGALAGRKGLDLHELNIDHEVIMEIVDEATDIIGQAFNLGEGPVTVEVAQAINQIHGAGHTWQIGYSPEHKEYCAIQFNDTSSDRVEGEGIGYSTDSLFEAIRAARQQNKKESGNES